MITIFPELPEWRFSPKEISPGIHEVLGVDKRGHRVAARAGDVETALRACRDAAMRIKEGHA
ncbi:MAG TPA: hypothetical protein VKU41_32340 [Polyangiaceae bacterium]|nr:hypothetical protein [Polyangiaceae bacterium]